MTELHDLSKEYRNCAPREDIEKIRKFNPQLAAALERRNREYGCPEEDDE